MNIVLFEPEIPYNTGNIGRTCVATNTKLHLIEPLGFSLDQKEIKRAGLDYWPKLNYEVYKSFEDFMEKMNTQLIGINPQEQCSFSKYFINGNNQQINIFLMESKKVY